MDSIRSLLEQPVAEGLQKLSRIETTPSVLENAALVFLRWIASEDTDDEDPSAAEGLRSLPAFLSPRKRSRAAADLDRSPTASRKPTQPTTSTATSTSTTAGLEVAMREAASCVTADGVSRLAVHPSSAVLVPAMRLWQESEDLVVRVLLAVAPELPTKACSLLLEQGLALHFARLQEPPSRVAISAVAQLYACQPTAVVPFVAGLCLSPNPSCAESVPRLAKECKLSSDDVVATLLAYAAQSARTERPMAEAEPSAVGSLLSRCSPTPGLCDAIVATCYRRGDGLDRSSKFGALLLHISTKCLPLLSADAKSQLRGLARRHQSVLKRALEGSLPAPA